MTKWVATAAVVVLLLGHLLWRVYAPSRPEPEAAAAELDEPAPAAPPAWTPPEPAPRAKSPAALAATPWAAPAPRPGVLDPESDEFFQKVEEGIPNHFYAAAARCPLDGLHRDAKLKIAFRLRMASGDVSVWDVRVLESTLGNADAERCMLDQIRSTHWTDPELPDWEDEEELVIRVRGLKKHMAAVDP